MHNFCPGLEMFEALVLEMPSKLERLKLEKIIIHIIV